MVVNHPLNKAIVLEGGIEEVPLGFPLCFPNLLRTNPKFHPGTMVQLLKSKSRMLNMKPRELSHDHSEFSKPKNRQIHQTNATCWNVEFKCSPTKRQNKSSKESGTTLEHLISQIKGGKMRVVSVSKKVK